MIVASSRFAHDVAKIKPLFEKSVIVGDAEILPTWSYRDKLQGILSSDKKRNGRSDETIIGDCIQGTAAEVGISKLLGVETYDNVWNISDRSSYGKDVVYDGIRIEVKSHRHFRRFTVSSHSYEVLMKSVGAGVLDLVVFAHTTRHGEEEWTVTPTVIADPYPDPEVIKFHELWDDDGFSRLYRADQAAKRGLCYPLIDLEA